MYLFGYRAFMINCDRPNKLDINDVSHESVDKAYKIYKREISDNPEITFNHLPVKVTKQLDYNLKEQTFEHIVSRDMKARLYDLNRLDKIPWISYIIKCCNTNCPNCVVINDRKNDYIIWCKNENYIIVLERRTDKITCKEYFYLKTAYPVIYKDKLMQLQKKEKKQNENGRN